MTGKLDALPHAGDLPVAYVALWSGEEASAYLKEELFGGLPYLAVQHRDAVGEGKPLFGVMSQVRQRRCIKLGLCQVCAQPLTRRYVVLDLSNASTKLHGIPRPLLTEPPTCATCAKFTMEHCPGVRRQRLRFRELLEWVDVLSFVRPVGDPSIDQMFEPLSPADFPRDGAIGYLKLAVLRSREAQL